MVVFLPTIAIGGMLEPISQPTFDGILIFTWASKFALYRS